MPDSLVGTLSSGWKHCNYALAPGCQMIFCGSLFHVTMDQLCWSTLMQMQELLQWFKQADHLLEEALTIPQGLGH